LDETIKDAERVLHNVEAATQSIGLFLNVEKTKYMSINLSNIRAFRTINGSELEMKVSWIIFRNIN